MAGYSMTDYYLPGIGKLPAALVANGTADDVINVLRSARAEGAVLAAIVPDSDDGFARYRSLGFAEFFMIERTKVRRAALGDAVECISDLSPERAPECNGMFFEVVRWRGHIGRSADMWIAAVRHATVSGGGLLAAEREGKLVGYAFYSQGIAGVAIEEIFCEDEPAFIALQRAVLDRCGVDEATLCAPACPHGAVRYGMVRALSCEPLIKAGLERRPGDFEIDVKDEELDVSAHYSVVDGRIKSGELKGRMAITAGEFAAVILGGGPAPYVNMVF